MYAVKGRKSGHRYMDKLESITNLRPYGPGKFSQMIDMYPHAMSMDGSWTEDYAVDGMGYFVALVWLADDMTELAQEFRDLQGDFTPNCDEQRFLLMHKGAVVEENDQGQVFVKYFRTAHEARNEFNDLASDLYNGEDD